MALAQKSNQTWIALTSGQPIYHDGVVASYETVTRWNDAERAVWGIYEIGSGEAPPEGQRIASSLIGGKLARPIWVNTFEPLQNEAPTSVTMRQARLALLNAGFLKRAVDAIASMPGQPGEEARIEFEYATTLRRDHPLVHALGLTLGLDDAAIDNLFRAASQIA